MFNIRPQNPTSTLTQSQPSLFKLLLSVLMAFRRGSFWTIFLALHLVLVLAATPTHARYNIGLGKADITGPAAEVVMMGYADTNQKSAGLLNRQYARAFVIENSDTDDRLLLVNCDVLAVFQLVHQEVLRQLKTKYNG
ncbi:hypothetical protein As57867_004969, partial [Aphanomyces stellatus]